MSDKESFSWERYNHAPIVAIVRGQTLDTVIDIAQAFEDSGLTTIEITMNTPKACEIISHLRENFKNLNIGAGTVCTTEDLENALSAGAQFIVTPILNEEVIKKSVSLGIPIFPGAYSPTEIYRAWSLGASMVKIFPASQLGPKFIKDLKGPLNSIKLLPTGGVSIDNIKSFFDVGASGVGMGSSLLKKDLLSRKDFEQLKNYFVSIKQEISDFIT